MKTKLVIASLCIVAMSGIAAILWGLYWSDHTNHNDIVLSDRDMPGNIPSPKSKGTTANEQQQDNNKNGVQAKSGHESKPDSAKAKPVTKRTAEEKIISTGFLFVDGKYIDIPYRVTIDGDFVKVNGVPVDRKRRSRPMSMPVDADDPGVPGWITENTTLGELVTAEDGSARGLVYKKWYYLVRTHPPKKAVTELVKYVEALPCISKVKLGTRGENEYYADLLVTSKKGKLLVMMFSSPPRKAKTGRIKGVAPTTQAKASSSTEPLPKEDLDRLHRSKRQIVRLLNANNAVLIYGPRGPTNSFGQELVARRFSLIIETMRSGKSREEKKRILIAMGIHPATDEFMANFQPSVQLEKRLASLIRKLGVKPYTVEDADKISKIFSGKMPASSKMFIPGVFSKYQAESWLTRIRENRNNIYATPQERVCGVKELTKWFFFRAKRASPHKKAEVLEIRKCLAFGLVNLAVEESGKAAKKEILSCCGEMVKYKPSKDSLGQEELAKLKKEVDGIVQGMLEAKNNAATVMALKKKLLKLPNASLVFVAGSLADKEIPLDIKRGNRSRFCWDKGGVR
jgi:hypothetical protein